MDSIDGINYFCFLMVTTQQKQKVNTSIEFGTDPLFVLQQKNKNKRDYSSDGEDTEPWKLELVVGPFPDQKKGQKFQKKWKKDSRGIPSRRKKGIELALALGLEVFDKRIKEISVEDNNNNDTEDQETRKLNDSDSDDMIYD